MKKNRNLKDIIKSSKDLINMYEEILRLLLIVVVFIISINCSKDCSIGDLILIKSKDNYIVTLKKTDFKATKEKKYIEIKILNQSKIDSINKLMNCEIFFSEECCNAKGIYIKSSIIPTDCDYFFTEDDNKRIIIRKRIITLLSINI